ncbi:hypothetical protein [Flavobacterium sp.]|uniref:hypothetical protein n=1 Tax=Flavobacterium sp. TaxID=239 RepID=UPI0039E2A345
MSIRSKSTYETLLYDFLKDIWVVCPHCGQQALVKCDQKTFAHIDEDAIRLICTACGHSKRLSEIPQQHQWVSRVLVMGGAIDPYFHQRLWLIQPVGGNVLWAYNPAHLDFLEQHVQAQLRERNTEHMRNKSLGSRLPKWMTSAKNRESVLKAIGQLREK